MWTIRWGLPQTGIVPPLVMERGGGKEARRAATHASWPRNNASPARRDPFGGKVITMSPSLGSIFKAIRRALALRRQRIEAGWPAMITASDSGGNGSTGVRRMMPWSSLNPPFDDKKFAVNS